MDIISPFSLKQREYLRAVFNSWFNVCEGGKRGGKNVLQVFAFCLCLEHHPSKFHLAAGVSSAAAKLNIVDCDGFGMLNYFDRRSEVSTYRNRDCVRVETISGEKIVLISGGGRTGDEKLIKGNSYGMAYITEANECAKSFVREVFDRTMSSPERKVFHDLNPKDERHWYYTDVLKHHEKMQRENADYGYNYGHFTIADNLSIDRKRLKEILATYDAGSLWYKRDILGERHADEGLIYESFAGDNERYIVDEYAGHIRSVNIGVDWGDSKSAHSFCASGIVGEHEGIFVIKSRKVSAKGTTPADLEREVVCFVKEIIDMGYRVDAVYCDHINLLIDGCRKALCDAGLYVNVVHAYKARVYERIQMTLKLLAGGRLMLSRDCKNLVHALNGAMWDERRPRERLDDGSLDVDSLDAFEYSWSAFIKQF